MMIRSICAMVVCAGLLVQGCARFDEGSSDYLDTVVIHVDELGPSNINELIEESSVIARATLDSIAEGAGYRGGYNEDEPTSEFVELIKLNFSIKETIKGESLDQLSILWDGYVVRNVGGTPAERLQRVSLAGADFTSNDVGQSFVLFLTMRGTEIDIITVTDGIARLLANGAVSPATNSGVLGIDPDTATIENIRSVSSSQYSNGSVGNVADPAGDTHANEGS